MLGWMVCTLCVKVPIVVGALHIGPVVIQFIWLAPERTFVSTFSRQPILQACGQQACISGRGVPR